MNRQRKASLEDALRGLSSISATVERIYEQEQDAQDNYPENMQGTDTYEKIETAAEALGDAVERLQEAQASIQSVIRDC